MLPSYHRAGNLYTSVGIWNARSFGFGYSSDRPHNDGHDPRFNIFQLIHNQARCTEIFCRMATICCTRSFNTPPSRPPSEESTNSRVTSFFSCAQIRTCTVHRVASSTRCTTLLRTVHDRICTGDNSAGVGNLLKGNRSRLLDCCRQGVRWMCSVIISCNVSGPCTHIEQQH